MATMRQQLGARVIPAMALFCLLGCRDRASVTTIDNFGVNRAYVTDAAAAALDANGFFVLTLNRSWKRDELSEADARRLGQTYVRRFARSNAAFHERLRGKPINFGLLTPCGRAYYASSPYEEPALGMPEGIVNIIAPRWVLTFCENSNEPAMSVAVATTATHLVLRDSSIVPSSMRGSEFYGLGIPVGKTMTVTPERAVEHLATVSGQRITAVPVLVLPGLPWEPLAARWHLLTEGIVRIRDRAGKHSEVSGLFVGRGGFTVDLRIFDGRATRPEDPPEQLMGPDRRSYALRRLPAMPRQFEEVTVEGAR